MTWSSILGHDSIVDRFRTNVHKGRLASTFLFIGPAGIGKRTFAHRLAQALLCETHSERELECCGACPSCQQVEAHSHPDLYLISKAEDKSFIPIEVFIGDREHRMREGLCHDISLKPFRGGRKIAIIDDADYLNQEGANCLLKTLEEPPPRSLIILIGTSEQRQLPTIRSRSQIVRFQPLSDAQVATILVASGHAEEGAAAERMASLGQGSVQTAIQLADEAIQQAREQLLAQLAASDLLPHEWAKILGEFVDQAGKEAPPRRLRMKLVIQIAIEFYRQLMRRFGGVAASGDEPLLQAVATAHQSGRHDVESTAASIERCLDALWQVDANANQATLLECWLDDLQLTRSHAISAR